MSSSINSSGPGDHDKFVQLVKYFYQQQWDHSWISHNAGENEGVLIRLGRNDYVAKPADLLISSFAIGCAELDLQCAMTINTRVVTSLMVAAPHSTEIALGKGIKIQVLPSMDDLPLANKDQHAAFVADQGLMVVWEDDVAKLLPRGKNIEDELINLIYGPHDSVDALLGKGKQQQNED